jgi:hypothetical protein
MYRHEKLPKLTRDSAGRYHGVYRGQEFVVAKEMDEREGGRPVWIARGGGIACRSSGLTRDGSVRVFCEQVDEAAVSLPEIDQLLARWTAEIKAVASRVSGRDGRATMLLLNLRTTLDWLDGSARVHAVRFEKDLAQLKTYIATNDAQLIDAKPAGDDAGERKSNECPIKSCRD